VVIPELEELKKQLEEARRENHRANMTAHEALRDLEQLQEQLDNERGWHHDELEDAKSARNRAIEKHDAMVSALRDQQLELAIFKGLVKEFLAAHKAMENATYWLNKVRTDEDYDDANRMVSDAHDQQEAVVEKAKMYVGDNHD